MKFLATATVVCLLVLLCNGCEYHRRLEERRRQAAELLRQRNRAAALTSAQNQAVADVRHSIYGGGSHHSDHGSSHSTTGRSRRIYSVPRQTNLPAGSKYCGGSQTYYCDNAATCIYSENGVWKCQYETSHTISRYGHSPTVTRTGGGTTYTRQRTQYKPFRPQSGDSVQRTQYKPYRPQSGDSVQRTLYPPYGPQSGDSVQRNRYVLHRPQSGDSVQRTHYTRYRQQSGENVGSPEYNTFRRRISTTYTCRNGYKRVNITSTTTWQKFKCVDIDECETESNECEHECENTMGGFHCTCMTGYKRNGTTECLERNECEESPEVCGSVAVCRNTEGSYTCDCIEGYRMNDVYNRCKEINECEEDDPCADDEICFNTWGSYECDLPHPCPEGYVHQNASAIKNQNCIREITTHPYTRETISFKKIAVEARKHASSSRLSSMTFSSPKNGYAHYFLVSVVNGTENFGYREHPTREDSTTIELEIELFNKKALRPNVKLPFTLQIIDEMVPKRLPYRTYGYGNSGRRQMSIKHEVMMEIVPMVHGTAEDP